MINSSKHYLVEIENNVKKLEKFNRQRKYKEGDLDEVREVVKEIDNIFAFECSEETIPSLLDEMNERALNIIANKK